MTQTKSKHRKKTLAETADKHALYLESVQAPDAEVEFFNRVYKKIFGKKPLILREDFCGSAAVCYEWVKSSSDRIAVGIDLDPEPLEWGKVHIASKLKEKQANRVTLKLQDVRQIDGPDAQILAAQNFSFWIFKTRDQLREYFKAALANLADDGMMVLDMMGGSEVHLEDHEDETDKGNFEYIWEQVRFDPITHDCHFYIHFRFEDDSEIEKAFEYEWRLWSIPEVKELLLEAGFSEVRVYWEGEGEDGEGDGIFRHKKSAPADPAWIAYMVALK